MKKIVFFDMDGTIYLGNKLLPYAKELFKYLSKEKIEYIFLTNNSSSNKSSYFRKMTNLGIAVQEDNFYSSLDHTLDYLKNRNIKKIYLLGIKEVAKIFEKENIEIVTSYKEGLVEAVVVAFDKELTYKKLEDASLYIQDGVEVIATHPDKRCPIEHNRYIPDCGAIIDLLESTTPIKKLTYLGKPHEDMLLKIIKDRNYKTKDAIIIGDRHYTDILCGVNASVESGLILTGESTLDDLKDLSYQPTYVFENLKSVYEYFINKNKN